MVWLIATVVVGAVGWLLLDRAAERRSRAKLRAMRDAFAFLQEYGLDCVRETDEGMSAVVEYKGNGLWLRILWDGDQYTWSFGLTDRDEFSFHPGEFCSTLQQAQQFGSKSVHALGEVTKANFRYLVTQIRSERAAEIVQGRRDEAALRLRAILDDPGS